MKGESVKQKLIEYKQKLAKFENDQNSLKKNKYMKKPEATKLLIC